MILWLYIELLTLSIFTSATHLINDPLVYNFTIETTHPIEKFELYNTFRAHDYFCLGTPYQCIKVQFDPEAILMSFLTEEALNASSSESHPSYQSHLSTTYEIVSPTIHGYYATQKMVIGRLSKESIAFNPFYATNQTIYLADRWVNEMHYSSIGLSYMDLNKNLPIFLLMLKERKLVRKMKFIIEYINDDFGKITYDTYDIASSAKYNKAFSVKVRSNFVCCNYIEINKLSLSIDNLTTILANKIDIIIDETFKFISMPVSMNHIMMRSLFLDQSNCEERHYVFDRPNEISELGARYLYYICTKDSIPSHITNAELIFILNNDSFSLKHEDMFGEYDNNHVIFNVLFKKSNDNYPSWIIGHPVLKHFMIERDFDNLMFTAYNILSFKSQKNSNDRSRMNDWSRQVIFSLINLAGFIMLLGLFVISLFLYKTKTRKA